MSDLRTRIIAAMKERAERDTDWMLADLADAAIAELRQLMVDKADEYVPSYAAVLRDFTYHVTDWNPE